jgi:hypothetical protein
MEVLKLTATQFLRPMGTGRTHPILVGAEDASGKRWEVVVKLRGPEMGTKAQVAELIASPLAEELGIDVPKAAVVEIPAEFGAIVPVAQAAAVRGSTGANFGSVHLGTSFTTWAVGRTPHGVQRDQASAIFAFDLLVQNPDRRAVNPNLWARSDKLGVYDHEQAFSFLHLPILGGPSHPWVLADQATKFRFMENHVFYATLRGGRVDLGPFETKLAALSDEVIQGLVDPVPPDWRMGDDLCKKIVDYLREAREEKTSFLNFVKHLLQ